MGCSITYNSNLGFNFWFQGRRISLLELCRGRKNICLFSSGSTNNCTDIIHRKFRNDFDFDIDSGLYYEFESENELENPIIAKFIRAGKRILRGGANSNFMCDMQNELVIPFVTSLAETEYGEFENENHNAEENMERIVDGQSKSFIPVDIGKSYLNEAVAYFKDTFGHLPGGYYTQDYEDLHCNINLAKSMENIESAFKVDYKFVFTGDKNKKRQALEVNYVLDGGILLFMSEPFNALITLFDKTEQLDGIIKCVSAKKQKKIKEKPKFKLLVHNQYGFGTEEFDLKSFDVDVGANYNDDLPDKRIRDFIEADAEAGLCILHGKPGTGKTYYIRDLIKNSKREFIYMNKECLNYINDSSFIAFLIKSKNSVFIMEDCENVLASRTEYNNTISTLLNLSDGLLGDSLNNKFVCTFNTDISNIDEALLRKGRMKVCYEFKYLSPEKANALAEKLNKKGRFDKEVPLCDVMNSESNGNEDIPSKKVGKIGF